jgi:hypothetical protein
VQATNQYGGSGTEDTAIKLFSDAFLAEQGALPVPTQQLGAASVTMRARYVFWNRAATRLFAITQADAAAGVLFDYSLYTVSTDVQCGIATVSTPTLLTPSSGGPGVITLTVGAGCPWTAVSSAPWVQVYPLNGTGSGAISYTIYPNYKTSSRSATLTVAGRNVSVTQAAASGSANERFVGLMYFNCLGRRPLPAEVAFHSANLAWMSRADTVMNFINSDEFNRSGRFIAGLYIGILGRDAEFGGWLFQRNAL